MMIASLSVERTKYCCAENSFFSSFERNTSFAPRGGFCYSLLSRCCLVVCPDPRSRTVFDGDASVATGPSNEGGTPLF